MVAPPLGILALALPAAGTRAEPATVHGEYEAPLGRAAIAGPLLGEPVLRALVRARI